MLKPLTTESLLAQIAEFDETHGKPMREATTRLLEAAYKIDPVRDHWRVGLNGLEYSGPLDLRVMLNGAVMRENTEAANG